MTMMRRTTFTRVGLALGGFAAALSAGCQGADTASPPVTDSPRVTACGLYAIECVPLAGSSPNFLATGDFNGDHVLDLAVANMGADNLSVLLNNGGGAFTLSANYAVGDSPFIVRTADMDGDGHPDLVSTGGSSVFTLRNDGDGTFRRGATITLSDTPFSLTTADFDGDGDIDIATANGLYRSITILLNDGQGKFTKAPPVYIPGDFTQLGFIDAADVDGDSRPDLIVVHTYGGKVSVLKNTGDASFAAPSQIELGETHVLNSVTPVDVDGDGHVDLAVADTGNPLDNADLGNVAILRNDGTGGFTLLSRIAAGDTPTSIAAADFNGDGRVDLAVTNGVSDDVSILLGTGGGGFAAPDSVPVGDGPSCVVAADLDGNGSPDLAVTNLKSDSVSILLNDGAGRFVPQP